MNRKEDKDEEEKYKTPGSFGLCAYGIGNGRLWKESIPILLLYKKYGIIV